MDNRAGRPLSVQVQYTGNADPVEYACSLLEADGAYRLNLYSKPPFTLRFGSPHFLSTRLTDVDPAQGPVNVQLINGDADGDNEITLFDYLVLDNAFGQAHPMADLDGDGEVTLFDYLIIDGSFGARGD